MQFFKEMWILKGSYFNFAAAFALCCLFLKCSAAALVPLVTRTYPNRQENSFTMIYRTANRCSSVVDMHYNASFVMDSDQIRDSPIIPCVRNNSEEQSIVVFLTETFFRTSDSVSYKANALIQNFREITGMRLKYVMTDIYHPNMQEFIDTFESYNVVFLNDYNVIQSENISKDFRHINYVKFDEFGVSSAKKLKKYLERSRKDRGIKPMSLDEYISKHSQKTEIARSADQSERPLSIGIRPRATETRPATETIPVARTDTVNSSTSTSNSSSMRPTTALNSSSSSASSSRPASNPYAFTNTNGSTSYHSLYSTGQTSRTTPDSSSLGLGSSSRILGTGMGSTASNSNTSSFLGSNSRTSGTESGTSGSSSSNYSLLGSQFRSSAPGLGSTGTLDSNSRTSGASNYATFGSSSTGTGASYSSWNPRPSNLDTKPSATDAGNSVNSDSSSKAPIITCSTPGTFILLIKNGLENYDNVKLHDAESAFVVTSSDLSSRREAVRRALGDGRRLVFIPSDQELTQISAVAAATLSGFSEFDLRHYILPETIRRDARQYFDSLANAREIRITSRFTQAEGDIERMSDPYEFINFVFVDLGEAESPAKLLQTLETKIERQNVYPAKFDQSVSSISSSAVSLISAESKHSALRSTLNSARVEYINRNNLGYYGFELRLNINRDNIFESSFNSFRLLDENTLKYSKIKIIFGNEVGSDAGGLKREWFTLLAREIFNPNYGLFISSETDQNVFRPNPVSQTNLGHLDYFRFVGQIIGKAISESIPINCHFTRSLYKAILGRPYTLYDLEEIDSRLNGSLFWMAGNSVDDAGLGTGFTLGEEYLGSHSDIDLKPNGADIPVTDANKFEYINLAVQYKLYGSCADQIEAFLQGFYQIIPSGSLSSFSVDDLKGLISGAAVINVADWQENTRYDGYTSSSQVVRYFWEVVRGMTPLEHRKLLRFATGSPSVPVEGFSHLRNNGNITLFTISTGYFVNSNSLPVAHTCFNSIDLPDYPSAQILREKLTLAINEGVGAFLMG